MMIQLGFKRILVTNEWVFVAFESTISSDGRGNGIHPASTCQHSRRPKGKLFWKLHRQRPGGMQSGLSVLNAESRSKKYSKTQNSFEDLY